MTGRNSRPEKRKFKHCLCDDCGEIGVCKPGHDYFDCEDDRTRCEPCTKQWARDKLGCRDFVEDDASAADEDTDPPPDLLN